MTREDKIAVGSHWNSHVQYNTVIVRAVDYKNRTVVVEDDYTGCEGEYSFDDLLNQCKLIWTPPEIEVEA